MAYVYVFSRTSAVCRGDADPEYVAAELPRYRYLESREDYRADLALAVLISHAEVKRRAVGCGRASGEMAEDGELPRSHNVGDRRHGRLSSSASLHRRLPLFEARHTSDCLHRSRRMEEKSSAHAQHMHARSHHAQERTHSDLDPECRAANAFV